MKATALLLAAAMTGCAGAQRQEMHTTDPRVRAVVIASPQEVDANCRAEGQHDDTGRLIEPTTEFNGCYREDTLTIWVNWSKNVAATLRHELCHAISGLSAAECERAWPYPVKYSMPGENVGGHWGHYGERP